MMELWTLGALLTTQNCNKQDGCQSCHAISDSKRQREFIPDKHHKLSSR